VNRATGGGVEQRRDDAAVDGAERVVVELGGRHEHHDAALLRLDAGRAHQLQDRWRRDLPVPHGLQHLEP